MKYGTVQNRRALAGSVALVIVVASVVAVGVIPPVREANVPDITPQSAVSAFWVSVGLHLLAALVLALAAARSRGRSWASTFGLAVTGLLVLFLGFALSDAALAFRAAGMRSVTMLLLLCVGADAVAGTLIIATAFLRPKPTQAPEEGVSS